MEAVHVKIGPLVFDHATIVDVERGRVVPAQRLVVTGRHIRAVGPVRSVPAAFVI